MSNSNTQITARELTLLKDEELVNLFKKGNEEAFPVLLARYHKPVFNFLLRTLGNEENAQEAFQETFLRVVKSIKDYKPTAKFSTWVYTIARNFCIDQKRKAKFRNHLSLDEMAENGSQKSEAALGVSSETGAVVAANELDEILQKVLDELNPEQKEVFLLREMHEMPFDEIARVTGVSLNTVKSRMRYAVLALQKKFLLLGINPK